MDNGTLEFVKDVEGIVEATPFERMCLWERYSPTYPWRDRNDGVLVTVGHVSEHPVCMSLLTSTVNGKKILFIDPTSQVVHHPMIEDWLGHNLPQTAFRDGGYLNKVDAQNFVNVLR